MADTRASSSAVADNSRQSEATPTIGSRIRRLRKERGDTLVAVAKRTGLSASALSKIENDKMSPTFANLMRLADGLEIPLSEMVAVDVERTPLTARFTVTRRADIRYRRSGGFDMGPLCADLVRKRMTPLIERVLKRDPEEHQAMIGHEGEEFVYVLSGTIEVHTEYYKPMRLETGDSLYLDSQMPHTYISVSADEAEILIIWLAPQPPAGTDSIEMAADVLNRRG